ncbi:sodium:proton exchanger [Saccharopolyspora erythraea]|uniref:sodium:calcium antiporter n=1 Tax=Saccharopolyspora erythraea TaxID=1836 RepID=UPI001BACA88D|nr:sodium:proton exchanger [Saccharopolyspora erythraea]QUH02225.1 sodium:proton exchanger [Saccharopolyspora erythraea]
MTSIFIFISGAVLLIYSAEKLVGYLVGAASGLRIPVFLLAIVFTGIEFDDVVLGTVLNREELQDVALGLVFGTAISFTGLVLALAAILTPTRIRVPRDYLAIFAAAPLVMVVFTLTSPITVIDGALMLGLFALFVAYIATRELRRDVATFRNADFYEEMRGSDDGSDPAAGKTSHAEMPFAKTRGLPGWACLGLAVLALAGLVIGASATSTGTSGILEDFGIEGTVFGATIVTLALTVEDFLLTVEPVRKGVPAIGIGNVIGSLVFSVTGKLGIIVLAGGSIVVEPEVLTWHLPVLIVLTALAAYFLHTGSLRRWHGYTLLGLYVIYWVVSFVVFGAAPVES